MYMLDLDTIVQVNFSQRFREYHKMKTTPDYFAKI